MPVRESKSIEVADIVRRRIDEGVYADQLPGMSVIARELGVNERTIMRGLAKLEAEGLVNRVRGHGTFVTRL